MRTRPRRWLACRRRVLVEVRGTPRRVLKTLAHREPARPDLELRELHSGVPQSLAACPGIRFRCSEKHPGDGERERVLRGRELSRGLDEGRHRLPVPVVLVADPLKLAVENQYLKAVKRRLVGCRGEVEPFRQQSVDHSLEFEASQVLFTERPEVRKAPRRVEVEIDELSDGVVNHCLNREGAQLQARTGTGFVGWRSFGTSPADPGACNSGWALEGAYASSR